MKHGNTNWNLYKTFIAVYEIKNMHRASSVLGTTRSAISLNIKELSNQLGAKLFVSHSKGVEPTSEAIAIYPMIKSAVELIIGAENNISKFNTKKKTTIKMAVLSTSAKILVQDYLKEFYTKHPEIKLEISGLGDTDLLAQKQQDLTIGTKRRIHNSLKTITLYTTKTAFVATKSFLKLHGLTHTISKEQLLKLPIIAHQGGTFASFCKRAGFGHHMSTILSSVPTDMIYSMTKDSMGVGFLGKETCNLLNEINDINLVSLNVYDIDIEFPTVQIVCGYDGTLTKPARIFIDGFSKFCRNRLHQNVVE